MRNSAVAALLACGSLFAAALPATAAESSSEAALAELPADSSDSYEYGFEDAQFVEQRASVSAGVAPIAGSAASHPAFGSARAVAVSGVGGSSDRTATSKAHGAGQHSLEGVEVAVNTEAAGSALTR